MMLISPNCNMIVIFAYYLFLEDVMITLKATGGLMDASYTNIDLGSYYTCSTEKDLSFNSTVVDKKINATLGITELQVQPFIEEKANGQFGSGK